jgi:cell division protein FtsW (lipid II flippase)
MKNPIPPLTRPGWAILLAALTLSATGILCMIAAPPADRPDADHRQLLFIAAALFAGWVVLKVGYHTLGRMSYVLFAVGLVLLILLIVARQVGGLPLIHARNHTYRWISLPSFSLQPSEVMKVAYVLGMAWFLRSKANVRRIGGLIGPFVLTLVPTFMVLLQPDLGTALLLMPVLFIMLFAAGARLKHLLTVVVLAGLCLPILWGRMHDYQKARIAGLLLQYPEIREDVVNNPPRWAWLCEPATAKNWEVGHGYQLSCSLGALCNGGWSGQGWGRGIFVRYDFLPAKHNDFIFAIIGEQWGFLGCLMVLTCYLIIILAGLEIALGTTDPFGKLVAVGVVALLSTQLLINVGMTIGLTPITGVTLPMVSYGGSSTLSCFLLLSLLISVSQHRPWSLARKPFEDVRANYASIS